MCCAFCVGRFTDVFVCLILVWATPARPNSVGRSISLRTYVEYMAEVFPIRGDVLQHADGWTNQRNKRKAKQKEKG